MGAKGRFGPPRFDDAPPIGFWDDFYWSETDPKSPTTGHPVEVWFLSPKEGPVAGGQEVTVRDLPLREQIDTPVREQLIVELYSK